MRRLFSPVPIFLPVLALGMLLTLALWGTDCDAAQEAAPGASPEPVVSREAAEAKEESAEDFLSRLEELDRRLSSLESEKERVAVKINSLDQQILDLSMKTERLRDENAGVRATVRQRLLVLYKYGQIGYAAPLLLAEKPQEVLEAGQIAKGLLRKDHDSLAKLHRGDLEIRDLEAGLARKRAELDATRPELIALEEEIASANREKTALSSRMGGKESLATAYGASSEQNGNSAGNKALSRKPIYDFHWTPFSAKQGSLPLPTAGEVIGIYGGKNDASPRTILYNGGVVIKAPRGQPIQAVHEGVVVFADWFREYGKVMIIDHGEHYYSLIAHADQLLKETGEIVKTGDIVAEVGNTGSPGGAKLYFEIRHNGKPVDPMEWLDTRKSSKE